MLTYKDLLLTGVEAVCILDAGLEIRQHNQLAGLLLGYRDRELNGRHVSDILYEDILIRRLLAPGQQRRLVSRGMYVEDKFRSPVVGEVPGWSNDGQRPVFCLRSLLI